MDKKTFTIAMALEIPIAFIVMTLLLNGSDDAVFFIAWALFAAAVPALFIYLKKEKDEEKKQKLRKKIARALLIAILVGAVVIVGVVAVFIIAYSLQAGF